MRNFYSLEAEAGVIGAMIIDRELVSEIGSFLDRSHFYNEDYAEIYALCLKLSSQRVKFDLVSLSDARETLPSGASTLSVVGDIQYSVPSAANALHYAKIVRDRYKARELFQLGKNISELSKKNGAVSEQIASAQAMASEIDSDSGAQDVYMMGDVVGEIVEDLQNTNDGKNEKHLGTGLTEVDKLLKGLRRGTLNVVAGRPGSGKSLMANMIARYAAMDNNRGALIFSLEMSNKELSKRMVSAVGGVSLDDIESAAAVQCPEKSQKTGLALKKVQDADIRVCDIAGLQFDKMCAIARYQHRANQLGIIIVDYIGLVGVGDNRRIQSRSQELGHVSRGLKQLSKELDIPIVALSQLNRGIETRSNAMPTMQDIRDSGEIEQDADTILICHRRDDEKGKNGLTMAAVVKNRHGGVGETVIQMQGQFARFVNAADGEYESMMAGSSRGSYLDSQFK